MLRRLTIPLLALALGLAIAVLPPARAEYAAGQVKDGGEVRGRIRLAGKAPASPRVTPEKDASVCKPHVDGALQVAADGGLANAVVWIEGVRRGKALDARSISVDQIGCVYTPRVQAVAMGSKVAFKNSDATFHNVHAYAGEEGETAFNLGMPKGSKPIDRELDESGVLVLKCDAGHSWMKAFVHVFEHPYFAVTAADGSFSMKDVPAGTWPVKVWHETLGELSGTAKVSAKGVATVDLAYAAK